MTPTERHLLQRWRMTASFGLQRCLRRSARRIAKSLAKSLDAPHASPSTKADDPATTNPMAKPKTRGYRMPGECPPRGAWQVKSDCR
jgi:hypothetical protein